MERRIDQTLDETEHSALPGGKSISPLVDLVQAKDVALE
jgi:hypothetical protein